jgi:hypothetical protein
MVAAETKIPEETELAVSPGIDRTLQNMFKTILVGIQRENGILLITNFKK